MKKILLSALCVLAVLTIGCERAVPLEKTKPFTPPKSIEERASEANVPLRSLAETPVVSDTSNAFFTISAAPGEPKTITLTLNVVEEPNFFLSVLEPSAEAYPGGVAVFDIAVSVTGGYSNPIRFSISGLPSGFAASFNPVELTSGTTRLTIQIPSAPALGSIALTVTATEVLAP